MSKTIDLMASQAVLQPPITPLRMVRAAGWAAEALTDYLQKGGVSPNFCGHVVRGNNVRRAGAGRLEGLGFFGTRRCRSCGHPVVLRCGRPVLIAPAVVQPSTLARIAVAWDGSSEAVRAVHDALPLLRLSRSVQIVEISHTSAEDTEIDCESLSAHLANYGIQVGTHILQSRSIEEHAPLRKQIEEGRYDLLVMGAYSHPVWLEFIFGGATKSILLSSTIPILVSH